MPILPAADAHASILMKTRASFD